MKGFGSDLSKRKHKPEFRTVTTGTESYRGYASEILTLLLRSNTVIASQKAIFVNLDQLS